MTDPFSVAAGALGIISLAIRITETTIRFGHDWRDAPKEIKAFIAELQELNAVLSSTTIILANPDVLDAFRSQFSQSGTRYSDIWAPLAEIAQMLKSCKDELESLLQALNKASPRQTVGWERFKAIFLAKKTRQRMEDLHRHCKNLNSMLSVGAVSLAATTYKAVKDVRIEQRQWQQAAENRAVLNWLSSVDYGAQQSDYLGRRKKGTCHWLLEAKEFSEFCSKRGRTMFCPGIPGAGKTTITSMVVDYLHQLSSVDRDLAVTYIYCNFRQQHLQSPEQLISNLLKQLLQQLPSIPIFVKALYDRHVERQSRPPIEEITQAMRLVLERFSRTFVIVDALDECQDTGNHRQRFVAELFSLRASTHINIFVTSRFLADIEKEFEESLTLEIQARDSDIREYLEERLSQAQPFNLLDHAYAQAMERIDGQGAGFKMLATNVLLWLTYARRPLKTAKLQHALAIELGSRRLDEDNVTDLEDIVSACAGLVLVDHKSSIIRLVHYTTQQYFSRTWKTYFQKADDIITEACVTYLSYDGFANGVCLTDEDYEKRICSHPFYDYAAQYWGMHASRSVDEGNNLVIDFLHNQNKVAVATHAMKGLTPLLWAIANGHEAVVKRLLGEDRVDVNRKDSRGQSPLLWAIRNRRIGLIQLLLATDGVDKNIRDPRGLTPLSWTAEQGRVAELKLLLADKDVDIKTKDRYGNTPLMRAIAFGQKEVVDILSAEEPLAHE
ncbi:hypothetical protein BCR34DRAFT_501433 [Clohesyomyces aquaticus]|uniref:Uncharacterized protein n=1 Tax=Clohesyomyces aquaticus TaxID=1231657 RepID=A0A1Y1Y0G8_9PLEO|nr:hypothetical protein BCR34DRAFT_501433 [Clohesyomyces aquaticus]